MEKAKLLATCKQSTLKDIVIVVCDYIVSRLKSFGEVLIHGGERCIWVTVEHFCDGAPYDVWYCDTGGPTKR